LRTRFFILIRLSVFVNAIIPKFSKFI